MEETESTGTEGQESESYESFDDFDHFSDEGEDSFVQSGRAEDKDEDEEGKEDIPSPKKEAKEKQNKDLGRKGDDMDALDLDSDEDEEEKPTKKKEASKGKEDEEESEEVEEKEQEEGKKPEETAKAKKVYLKVGDETFGIGGDSLVPVIIDGKKFEVPLQELRNEYSGKKYAEKQLENVNIEKQRFTAAQKEFQANISKYQEIGKKIHSIAQDVEQNPKEALKVFLDAFGYDTYDLEERMFRHDLAEFSKLISMEDADRRAYLLEKKNGHLQAQMEKRSKMAAEAERVKSYADKTNQLRKSLGVSEAQYVDAFEELTSQGHKNEELTEQQIVEWAATKPHRETVQTLLKPYEDEFSDEAYGELTWNLAQILLKGESTKEEIQKHLQDIYGVPTIVKDLNEKFNPVGRKQSPSKKPATSTSKNKAYESFDDFDEE